MIVFKLGGSLVTNKSGVREIDPVRIAAYARNIVASGDALIGKSVAVLGGGSFGNRTILDLGLDDTRRAQQARHRSIMTETMLDYTLQVLKILRDHGIPVFPVQIAPFFCDPAGPRILGGFLRNIVEDGILPVLTGDYVCEGSGEWRVISSDELLVVLARELLPDLVIAMSDVPGVRDFVRNRTLSRVHRGNCDHALALTSGSAKPDATGGMRAKLQCLLRIAEMGMDSIIVDGRDASALPASLAASGGALPDGATLVEAWSRAPSTPPRAVVVGPS